MKPGSLFPPFVPFPSATLDKKKRHKLRESSSASAISVSQGYTYYENTPEMLDFPPRFPEKPPRLCYTFLLDAPPSGPSSFLPLPPFLVVGDRKRRGMAGGGAWRKPSPLSPGDSHHAKRGRLVHVNTERPLPLGKMSHGNVMGHVCVAWAESELTMGGSIDLFATGTCTSGRIGSDYSINMRPIYRTVSDRTLMGPSTGSSPCSDSCFKALRAA